MERSELIVQFISNLMPVYLGERHGELWCARDLERGSLICPSPGSPDDDAFVRVSWNGDDNEIEVQAELFASVAVTRYVQFHGVGHPTDIVSQELRHLARHFEFKTGVALYLPSMPDEPTIAGRLGRAAAKMGEGLLTTLLSRLGGL